VKGPEGIPMLLPGNILGMELAKTTTSSPHPTHSREVNLNPGNPWCNQTDASPSGGEKASSTRRIQCPLTAWQSL
jgi:hypothetical protein